MNRSDKQLANLLHSFNSFVCPSRTRISHPGWMHFLCSASMRTGFGGYYTARNPAIDVSCASE